MMLPLYRLLTTILGPVIGMYLARRRRQGKEDPVRFAERLGTPGAPRPEGRVFWLHAASVGEAQSMLPLIGHLLHIHPDVHLLFTTGTVSSARMIEGRLPPRAIHQYVPVDRPGAVRSFLDHWQPEIALWAESEFWPNLIDETQRRGIPMILINGRISPRSYRGWQRAPGLLRGLLRRFDMCLGQTEGDAARLRDLGATAYKCVGNLKFASPPLAADEAALSDLAARTAGRPIWIAASTHEGEEKIAAAVHRALTNEHPGLLTVIAPRHADRGPGILASLANGSAPLRLRSKGELPEAETGIYIADTMGELGLFFRLADVVFMGKSLVPLGGQNPLEPLKLDRPVLHGPHMANFQDMADHLASFDGAVQVKDEEELRRAVDTLLKDHSRRAELARNGRSYADAQSNVVEAVSAEIERLLKSDHGVSHT